MGFAESWLKGIELANEHHRQKQRTKLEQDRFDEEKRARGTQEEQAQKQFDLQSFLAQLATAQKAAEAQNGVVDEVTGPGPGIVAPAPGPDVAAPAQFNPLMGILSAGKQAAPVEPTRIPPAPIKVTAPESLKGAGFQDVSIPIISKQEAQRRKSDDQKASNANAMDLFKQQQTLKDQLEAVDVGEGSPLTKYGVAPGKYKPQELTYFTQLKVADESAKARVAAATEAALARKDVQGAMQAQRDFTRASGLRDDYRAEKAYKDYTTVAPQFTIVADAAKDPSAAGDLALIFSYMKILDPGSTVREGEFANAANSGSIPQKIIGQYNKIINGQRLSADQRTDFVTSAKRVFQGYQKQKDSIDKLYTDRAKQAKVDTGVVVAPSLAVDIPEIAAPQVLTAPSGATFSFVEH